MENAYPLPVRIRRVFTSPIRVVAKLAIRMFPWLVSLTKYGKVTFYPLEQLPWTKDLEANWSVIRKELDALMPNVAEIPNVYEAYPGQEKLSTDDKWKAFTLYCDYKFPHPTNSLRCPETTKLLSKVPNLGHAMFSILGPHKHLAAHCGPYAGLLNCHLGLKMPPNPADCRIRVGEDVRSWQEGKMLVFDDTNEHEVWNDSDHTRVVMLFYVVRPLPFPVSALNFLIRGFAAHLVPAQDVVTKPKSSPASAP